MVVRGERHIVHNDSIRWAGSGSYGGISRYRLLIRAVIRVHFRAGCLQYFTQFFDGRQALPFTTCQGSEVGSRLLHFVLQILDEDHADPACNQCLDDTLQHSACEGARSGNRLQNRCYGTGGGRRRSTDS